MSLHLAQLGMHRWPFFLTLEQAELIFQPQLIEPLTIGYRKRRVHFFSCDKPNEDRV